VKGPHRHRRSREKDHIAVKRTTTTEKDHIGAAVGLLKRPHMCRSDSPSSKICARYFKVRPFCSKTNLKSSQLYMSKNSSKYHCRSVRQFKKSAIYFAQTAAAKYTTVSHVHTEQRFIVLQTSR